jgi:hypothetical protein
VAVRRQKINLVAPACSVVVVVLHGSVDVVCDRGVKKKTCWFVVLYLVEVPMAILVSVSIVVVCCVDYPRRWMRYGTFVWMIFQLLSSVSCYCFVMVSGGWVLAPDRWW